MLQQMEWEVSTTTRSSPEPWKMMGEITGQALEDRIAARSCPLCQLGIVNYQAVAQRSKRMSLDDTLRVMSEAGELEFCECEHGQRRMAGEAKLNGQHVPDMVRQREAQVAASQARRKRLFGEVEVPERFGRWTIDSYKQAAAGDPGKQMAIRAAEVYRDKGFVTIPEGNRYGLFFWGNSDMGKTGLLCPLFLHLLETQDASGLWIQYNELMAETQSSSFDQEAAIHERITACKQVEYLFIDDFFDPKNEWTTAKARDVMFRIIDHRCNYQKPTFITSNVRPDELEKVFHQRMVKRINELCAVVEVAGAPLGVLKKVKR
jgi:DNA replication protein DnaC